MSRARECGEKIQYRSRKDADWKAFQLKRRALISMHPYKCKFCSSWHLGHSTGYARFR